MLDFAVLAAVAALRNDPPKGITPKEKRTIIAERNKQTLPIKSQKNRSRGFDSKDGKYGKYGKTETSDVQKTGEWVLRRKQACLLTFKMVNHRLVENCSAPLKNPADIHPPFDGFLLTVVQNAENGGLFFP